MHHLFFKTSKVQIMYEKWIEWIFEQKKIILVVIQKKKLTTLGGR